VRAAFVWAALCTLSCAAGPEPGRLRLAVETSPLTLDPRGAFNADTAHVQQLVFNTLVSKGPNFDFAPELAESWEMSPDLTVCVFRLRRGVRFHDGRPLTARDVAYTFGSMLDGGHGKSASFHALARVEAVDELTVRFVSRAPNPGLLVDLIAVGVLPEGSGEEVARSPIGTGAYIVADYAGEGDLRLESFEEYYGGRPQADGIDVHVIADPATREAALEAGEVDLAINAGLSADALARLGSVDAETRVVTSPGGGVEFIALNVTAPGLRDPKVRRALAMAIDRETIVRALRGGHARLANGPLPPEHWAAAALEPLRYDPAEASRALASGRGPRSLELLVLTRPADLALASVVLEAWARVGVEARITSVEPAVFFERLAFGEFGAAIHRLTGGNQFTTIFKGAFHSRAIRRRGAPGGEINYARFGDASLDRLIDRADLTHDRGERARLYAEIQERIADAAPWIFLWHPDNVVVAGPRVATFDVGPGGDFFGLRAGPLAPEALAARFGEGRKSRSGETSEPERAQTMHRASGPAEPVPTDGG
jgi:peptide/nickel transport system substrate-binding protein